MTRRTLLVFFILTFGISWGILAMFVLFTAQAEATFGKLGYTNPLFILAVYAPALSALGLVVHHHGFAGLGPFVSRLLMWRMPWGWWLLLIAGLPLVSYSGAAIKGTIGSPFPFDPWWRLLPALLTTLAIGPVEEIGWRGLALPLMQRQLAPLWASLWLGLVWALWHLPAFFLSGTPQSNWSLPGFVLGCVALSVILTPMFNAARGSLLVPTLFHFQVNGPAWPDAQPWDSVIFAALAAALVVSRHRHYVDRGAGAIEVLNPPPNSREAHRP